MSPLRPQPFVALVPPPGTVSVFMLAQLHSCGDPVPFILATHPCHGALMEAFEQYPPQIHVYMKPQKVILLGNKVFADHAIT